MQDQPIQYLYIDFNSLIYQAFHEVSGSQENDDAWILETLIHRLDQMIHHHVRPSHGVYVCLDGVAPLAKMVQQRSRRYKGVLLDTAVRRILQQNGIQSSTKKHPSCHICPGTVFMAHLETRLRRYQRHCSVPLFIDGSNVPGEGEHKLLAHLRRLRCDESQQHCQVVIYSPDGDLFSLTLLTHKSHLYLMRIPDASSPLETPYTSRKLPYIYCCIDRLRSHFLHDLFGLSHHPQEVNERHLHSKIEDYNLLLMMVGNDVVPSLPYLKIRAGGLQSLLRLYQGQCEDDPTFHLFCIEDPSCLHLPSLQKLWEILALQEEASIRREWRKYQQDATGIVPMQRREQEANLSPVELFQ